MNTIGNDNYRPGLTPPEPIRQHTGWLSSNMAQLMVFLNGLILTITAFATLSVFIEEIVREGLLHSTEEVQTHIISNYKETEKTIENIAALIRISDADEIEKVKSFVQKDSVAGEKFEQIFWVFKQDEAWVTVPLLEEGYEGFDVSRVPSFVQSIMLNKKEEIVFSPQSPAEEITEIKQYHFSLASRIENRGYVLGVTQFNYIVKPEWLKEKENLNDVQIIDASHDFLLFGYKAEKSKSVASSKFLNVLAYKFANQKIDITIEMAVTAREAFLQKIPLLLLLFGITLTLIGTLYVRNNQTQSKKLAVMNKELAYKNFELNQEINERERLNKVIQKSAREHRAIINAVSDIIFEASTDGKILFLNEAWQKVTGFDVDHFIGRSLFDLIYVQDQEEQKINFENLAKGKKQSYRVFTRLRSSNGTFRAVELAVSMIRQDENKDLRIVGTITDVEERRRAERALSEAEKKYRMIVENAAGGIYQVTPEGQFLSANPAFARIIGYANPEEVLRVINHAHEQLYSDPQERLKFLKDIAALNIPGTLETQIIKKDGTVIWASENVRPVRDDEGTLLFYEGSIEDVDQRKKAEIALKEAKTESDLANRAKSEFLANMSHELRTPLNAVIGFAEIIKNETFGPLPKAEYKEYADNIYQSGQNLLNVINEILDVSRIEAGERTLNEGIVNVRETIMSCLSLMETKIKDNKIRVENKVTNQNISFIGEKQAVKQMILNLMSNAVKFSPPQSLMMLDSELDSKGRLRISVTDTGKGLDESEVKKALSPFGQLDTEHKRSKSGTGLGLTLVKSLVELHGGELEMVSQKGIGTTVTLIFPAKRVSQSEAAVKTTQNTISDRKDA